MLICHWYEPADEPGARLLVPGCMTRVNDPDGECTCETTTDTVARLRDELQQAEQTRCGVASALSDLADAVVEHADGRRILARADQIRRSRNEARTTRTARPAPSEIAHEGDPR